MSNEKQITIIEQREVDFYDDRLVAVRASDGHVYAALSQMCDALGIDAQAQRRRIERTTVLEKGMRRVAILATHRGRQVAYVLRADLVPLWLSGIRTKSVSEEIRPKLERFQEEAGRVLWEAFQTGELSLDESFSQLLEQDSPAAQAYKMISAMLRMARQQLLIESQVNEQGKAIAVNTASLSDIVSRVESLEADAGRDDRLISNAQAVQIAQGVKQIAFLLSKNSGTNAYGGVYGELHRRFEIPSYRQLPAAQFDEAMHFLRDWWQALTDSDNVPF